MKFRLIFKSWVFWIFGGIFSLFSIATDEEALEYLNFSEIIMIAFGSYLAVLLIAFIGWLMFLPVIKNAKR